MDKSWNLSGLILSVVGNLLVCISSIFNFFIPFAFPESNSSFIPLYLLTALILIINMTSLTFSVLLLLSENGIYKNFKAKNIFIFILLGLNLLTIILEAIFMLLYPWGAILLNGFIVFVLLTTSCIFSIICIFNSQQKSHADQKPENLATVTNSNISQTEKPENSQNVKAPSEEEKLQDKLNILSSMKNMGVVSEEEFSEIKKKLVYDYLNKKDTIE